MVRGVRGGDGVKDAADAATGGGGGGHLEGFAPNRTWFSSNKRVDHHFLMVNVNGGQMEISAYDIEGRLFDRLLLNTTDRRK